MASRAMLGLPGLGLLVLVLAACQTPPKFPLREPLWDDDDRAPFTPAPEEYVSPFAWDAADQSVFRPLARAFAVDSAGPAIDVNALDEVPNSSWFVNRLGTSSMTPEDVVRGSCEGPRLDPNAPDGTWIIDKGKDDGANLGFRINVPGIGKFMLKADPPTEPERATGATAIGTRLYHAVGYYAPCDTVVYFRPSILSLKPGLTVTNNQGVTRPFDRAALDSMLAGAVKRQGLVRMVASQWLPGKPLGPFRYWGQRQDDPNDAVDHEDRRELRGARLLAAWINHFDAREQNTMDVFMAAQGSGQERGYVRHYIMDLGDCFGSVWSSDAISRRLGNSYLLDFSYMTEDFLLLGTQSRPWERARRLGGVFNYFSARGFDPEAWRAEYPNPAFSRMSEADGAWMARILAHFSDELVAAAVSVGAYDAPSTRYLTQTLIARRDAILRRYLTRLSPVTHLRVEGNALCGVDLARRGGIVPDEGQSYRAVVYRGDALDGPVAVTPVAGEGGRVCVELPRRPDLGSRAAEYVVVALGNGYSPEPLWAHLYDLGPRRGYRLVGLERMGGPLPTPRELQP